MKLYNLINPKIIILTSFIFSLLISNYNLNTYDDFFIIDGEPSNHKMIKYDAYRYMSHGAEIKKDIENGKSFFESGREHFTKYLPPRIAAAYYYTLDINLFDNFQNKKINLGIHFPYLIIQCLIYYISLFFLYSVISKKFEKKACMGIIFFLALEPTIFQYHGTFWTESIFFSIQLIIMGLILNDKVNLNNFFILGIFLSLLSLQKQVAYFYIGPILIYYILFIERKKYFNFLSLFIGFFIIQIFVGYNNYLRSGKFYLLTADTKTAVYHNIVEQIVVKSKNISPKEFKISEGKIAFKWLKDNKIDFNEDSVDVNTSRYPFADYRFSIVHEKDKIKYDEFFANRSILLLKENSWEATKLILKKSIHVALLNPFHIYSDHNFISGEIYYTTETHDKLVPVRIVYTLIIYIISIIGFYNLLRNKNYKLLSFLILSMMYFYGMVSWHGNTRYFVPVLIYLSFFFGFGFQNFKLKNIMSKQ
tara:strand:- start:1074 stop:2504 length:1431 start_codon:yes stop_codon:yes gene_type:complete